MKYSILVFALYNDAGCDIEIIWLRSIEHYFRNPALLITNVKGKRI